MPENYLRPSTRKAKQIRDKKNGMFANPPAYMESLGGFTSAGKLPKQEGNMPLERGGPQAKRGRPF